MIQSGRLDQRVTIRRPTYEENGYGERVPSTPTKIATRWARVKPLSGNEKDFAERVQAELVYEVELREPIAIQPQDYILWDTRTLEVVAIMPPPRKGYVIVQCKETT